MINNLFHSVKSSKSNAWLFGSITFGLVAASTALFFHSLTSETKDATIRSARKAVAGMKDGLSRVARRVREANPSVKEQILDAENELQPGG